MIFQNFVRAIIKAAGHRYIKRIPYTTPKGRRYRYIYRVSSTHRGRHAFDAEHLVENTKFALHGQGESEFHGHITDVEGDTIKYVIDDGPRKGEEVTTTRAKLVAELNEVHGVQDKLTAERAKVKDAIAEAKRAGHAGVVRRLERRLRALGGEPEAESVDSTIRRMIPSTMIADSIPRTPISFDALMRKVLEASGAPSLSPENMGKVRDYVRGEVDKMLSDQTIESYLSSRPYDALFTPEPEAQPAEPAGRVVHGADISDADIATYRGVERQGVDALGELSDDDLERLADQIYRAQKARRRAISDAVGRANSEARAKMLERNKLRPTGKILENLSPEDRAKHDALDAEYKRLEAKVDEVADTQDRTNVFKDEALSSDRVEHIIDTEISNRRDAKKLAKDQQRLAEAQADLDTARERGFEARIVENLEDNVERLTGDVIKRTDILEGNKLSDAREAALRSDEGRNLILELLEAGRAQKPDDLDARKDAIVEHLLANATERALHPDREDEPQRLRDRQRQDERLVQTRWVNRYASAVRALEEESETARRLHLEHVSMKEDSPHTDKDAAEAQRNALDLKARAEAMRFAYSEAPKLVAQKLRERDEARVEQAKQAETPSEDNFETMPEAQPAEPKPTPKKRETASQRRSRLRQESQEVLGRERIIQKETLERRDAPSVRVGKLSELPTKSRALFARYAEKPRSITYDRNTPSKGDVKEKLKGAHVDDGKMFATNAQVIIHAPTTLADGNYGVTKKKLGDQGATKIRPARMLPELKTHAFTLSAQTAKDVHARLKTLAYTEPEVTVTVAGGNATIHVGDNIIAQLPAPSDVTTKTRINTTYITDALSTGEEVSVFAEPFRNTQLVSFVTPSIATSIIGLLPHGAGES